MLKRVDTVNWSLEDLTGGGCLVETSPSTFVVVSPVRSDNTFVVRNSTDNGETWTTRATYTYPYATGMSEPQIVFDGTNTIYIVTTKDNDDGTNSLLVFKYTVSTHTLGSPTTIVTAQKIKSAYAIGIDGSEVVVVASVSSPTLPVAFQDKYALVEVVLNTSLTVLRSNVLATSPLRTGDTYGSVDLAIKSGVVDVFWVQHPRKYTFTPKLSQLYTKSRTTAGSWSDGVVLNQYMSEFNDDKFTVYQDTTGNRYLLHLWYHVTSKPDGAWMSPRMTSTLLLGYCPDGGSWSFMTQPGGTEASISEPTLSLSADGVVLAFLKKDFNTQTAGQLTLMNWIPTNGSLVARSSRLNGRSFTWLRGSKALVDTSSKFAFLGLVELEDGTEPYFLSDYNLPAVPAFTASSFTLRRGVTYVLDPSGTSDPDYDTLQYIWTTTSASPHVSLVLQDNGSALLRVEKAIGPSEVTFDVSLVVKDLDISGNVIHTSSPVVHTFTVPAKPQTLVLWKESSLRLERNATYLIQPLIWDQDGYSFTTSWKSVGAGEGPWVLNIPDTPGETLLLNTAGALISGGSFDLVLTINDGINGPVEHSIQVTIPPVDQSLAVSDRDLVYQSLWGFTISGRNFEEALPTFSSLGFRSNLTSVTTSVDNVLMVSPFSIRVLSVSNVLLATLFPPKGRFVSAFSATPGEVWAVFSDTLGMYNLSAVEDTDNPTIEINLQSHLPSREFRDLWVSESDSGSRVIAVLSDQGVLLLEVSDQGVVVDKMILNVASGTLYGSSDARWIEGSPSVQGLYQGFLLVGTVDPDTYACYESLIDLSKRALVKTWDAVNALNRFVTCGEVLGEGPYKADNTATETEAP